MGEYIKKQTINDVRNMFDVNAIYLYEWNIHTCSEIAGACDLAVIPMNKDDIRNKINTIKLTTVKM